MSFLWDLAQQGQIAMWQERADHAAINAHGNARDLKSLEARLDTLTLANQAMWEMLSVNLGYTKQDLLAKMEEIDLRDGVKDGRVTPKDISVCPECGHKIRNHRANCYWCGAKLDDGNPFTG